MCLYPTPAVNGYGSLPGSGCLTIINGHYVGVDRPYECCECKRQLNYQLDSTSGCTEEQEIELRSSSHRPPHRPTQHPAADLAVLLPGPRLARRSSEQQHPTSGFSCGCFPPTDMCFPLTDIGICIFLASNLTDVTEKILIL